MRVAWLIAIVALAGCGSDPAQSATPSGPLPSTTEPDRARTGLDGEWQAISGVIGGQAVQLIDSAPITLTANGRRISGAAACNSYESSIVPRGSSVEVVGLSHNDMACEPPIAALEERFLASFGPAATYVIEGDVLTWETATATWRFARVAPIPPAPLVGTEWVLNGVTSELGAMGSSGMERGRVVFAGDGTFTGSTACRDLTGSWVMEGSTIIATEVGLDGECEGPLAQVDEIVARTFRGGLHASVAGNRLVARVREDLGVEFLAARCTEEEHRFDCFHGELTAPAG